jgi:hypothetical protein
MGYKSLQQLKARSEAALANLNRQLQGLEPHMEQSDAPGEWTTREVLSHLLDEPGWNPVDLLKSFSERNLPLVEISAGETHLTPERKAMTLRQFADALDSQHRNVFAYLEGLDAASLERKARIPLFKQFMGTDEIAIPVFVGAMFDFHWNDHAGQLAKIRKAVGLSEAP